MAEFAVPTGPMKPHIPHKETWMKLLETQIQQDLASIPGHHSPPPMDAMKHYVQTTPKYRRSCMFVCIKANHCTIELPTPEVNARGFVSIDSRVHTFNQMVRDLAQWCTHHGLTLPETEFAIYSCDTYAWEPEAAQFPWFVLAKPANRPGILIPDDSFLSHGMTGNEPVSMHTTQWAWDTALAHSANLRASQSGSMPTFFFKGANTGATKWNTRDLLRSQTSGNARVHIDLTPTKESWVEWGRYGALLDLPGNQPWSYRRKYLHLLGRPIIQLDVERFTSSTDSNGTARWIQFFDKLLVPYKDYVPQSVTYIDVPPVPEWATMEATGIHASMNHQFASKFSGRRKMRKLTSSHVLQYLYMTLWHYKLTFE